MRCGFRTVLWGVLFSAAGAGWAEARIVFQASGRSGDASWSVRYDSGVDAWEYGCRYYVPAPSRGMGYGFGRAATVGGSAPVFSRYGSDFATGGALARTSAMRSAGAAGYPAYGCRPSTVWAGDVYGMPAVVYVGARGFSIYEGVYVPFPVAVVAYGADAFGWRDPYAVRFEPWRLWKGDAAQVLADYSDAAYLEASGAGRRAVKLALGDHLAAGGECFRQRRYEDAVKAFRSALVLVPGDTGAQLLFALALQADGTYELAAKALRRSLEGWPETREFPADLSPLFAAGAAAEQVGRLRDWAVAFPEDGEAKLVLAWMLAATGDRPGALAALDAYLAAHPADPAATKLRAYLVP